ncbi:MGMT family protein [Peribacillus sp. SCS-155]|uniref:MGMT family protein n=1 Tax=Peribacillus sedimenti TaxID=3115297 RepID=UPI003905C0A7
MEKFTEKVIQIIKSIPEGKIMTYGQIARIAGNPRAARQVVRILHSMSDRYQLPWHRVINAKGEIAVKDGEANFAQRKFLEAEGVETGSDNRIDVECYRFHPEV